jgi:hypothetical protein
MLFYKFDLKEITKDLGDHYDPTTRDEITAWCPGCGEQILQDAGICFVCEKPVVWLNSSVWRDLFGSPTDAIRRLTVVPPSSTAGVELCRLAGVDGFRNQAEADRFSAAEEILGLQETERLVNVARRKLNKRGRGLMAYAINLLHSVARDKELQQAPVEEPETDLPSIEELRY